MTDNKNIIIVKNVEGDPDTTAEIVIQNKIDFEPKVSVIIPVYNVEEYLRECLDSVVNQTLKEIEIICVDDGSTDSSLDILKEYAEKDNRITVMKQANLYAGVARNAGLSVAKGEYLSFLDSDDFFELNMLEEMYKNCKKNKIDVCICDVQFYDNATKKTIFPEWTLRKHFIPQKNVFNCFDIAENIFHITNNWPWNKMFSKHFIKQLNLCFQNTSHTNDTYFVCVALINGKNITVMKDKFVHYRTNVKNSLTSSFSRNKAPDNINRVLSAIYKKIKNNKIFYRSFVNLCCEHLTWNLRNITDKESSEILKSKIIENNFYDIPSDLSSDYFYSDKIYNEYLSILDILPGKVIDRNLIISQLENFEYISFDIFDTILLRPFSNPFDLFSYIGETINDNNFAKLRMESERTARRENSEEEITLSDIYSYLPEKYQKLMEFEKQLELKFVLINPHISDILSYAKELGKKIIFISDMYLDKKTISKMLQKFNLEKYPLFLSSEIKKTKKTGTLFKYVLSNLKINCNQLLHIGDNIESDILMPQKLGINVCQIKKYIDMYKSPFQIDFKSKSYSLDASVVNALIKLNLHSRNNSYWFNIGYNLGGPLAHSYVNFVDNQVEADELDELLFIARDGFVLKEIYPIIAKNICKTHYIFASRGLIQNINNNPTLDTEYETYLKSKKINGTKLGLIDTTTINFSAQKFLQGYLLNKKLKGLYWLANKNSDANIEYKYIFSRPHKIEALNFLVETLITAPHPPVNKIFNNEPVYEDMSDLEKNRCSIYEKIVAGIIQFNKDMVNIFKKTIEIKPDTVFILLSDWIKNYTQEDYDNFLKLSHSGNISNTNNKPLSIYLDRFPRNKVSVIISVYNVEEYLRECLDSVVNQTLKEIEIICVNDGSTDSSLEILKEYAQKENRIIIINQENQGLSCSRNNALKIANGKYIVFLDSDDYISNDALDKIYRSMEYSNLDMLSYSGINFDDNTKEKQINNYWEFSYLPNNFNFHKFSFNECKNFAHRMAVSSCLTAYRFLFLKQNNIEFPAHLFFEDNFFFTKALLNAQYCGIIKDKLYFRRIHKNQITQNWENKFSDYLKIVDLTLTYLTSKKIEKNIFQRYAKKYIDVIQWQYNKFSLEGKAKYKQEIDDLIKKHQVITTKKLNPIKPYILFPVYLIKTARMKKKIHKKVCRIIREQLSRQFENTLLLTKPQIRDFALKNSPAPDYVKKNIKKITNDIYDKFHFRKKHRILGIKFYTKNKHKELSSLLTYSIKQNDLLKQENSVLKSQIEETKKELQKNKNDILTQLAEFKNKNQRNYQELNYADLLHDTIHQSNWLKDKTFSLFGWAANYSFIYLLFRTLDQVCPSNILEFGLGQTTKLTSQYIVNKNPSAQLNICEHNQDWINIYKKELAKSENIKINHLDLEFFEYDNKQNDKYKNIIQVTKNQKFDLIIVDGPVGGGKNLPRSNIHDLIKNDNLANDFIIIFDDAERKGEQETIRITKDLLTEKNIQFSTFSRNGIKNQFIITSPSREFLKFL